MLDCAHRGPPPASQNTLDGFGLMVRWFTIPRLPAVCTTMTQHFDAYLNLSLCRGIRTSNHRSQSAAANTEHLAVELSDCRIARAIRTRRRLARSCPRMLRKANQILAARCRAG